MQRNCTAFGAEHGDLQLVYTDVGLTPGDTHTMYSAHRDEAALSAFLDFLFLMDATVIVRTRSSFSGMVTAMKGLPCYPITDTPANGIMVCVPRGCSKPPFQGT